MNKSTLVWTSLGIAVLFHLALFSLITIVFPIEPEALKPKLFFLGPILGQTDIENSSGGNETANPAWAPSQNQMAAEDYRTLSTQERDQADNPFLIESINKPAQSRTVEFEPKQNLKSTFPVEYSPETKAEEPGKVDHEPFDLDFGSYKPLHVQKPSK